MGILEKCWKKYVSPFLKNLGFYGCIFGAIAIMFNLVVWLIDAIGLLLLVIIAVILCAILNTYEEL